MKFFIFSLIVFISFLAFFSFWPAILGAHYNGAIECPIMGGSFKCQSMDSDIGRFFSHISSFMSMISFIISGSLVFAFFYFYRSFKNHLGDILLKLIALSDRNAIPKIIKFYLFLFSNSRDQNVIFLGLKRGILNTKVF